MELKVECEVKYEEDHWNQNCQSTIPEGWVGIVYRNGNQTGKIFGESAEDVKAQAVKHFGPNGVRFTN